MAEGRMIQTNDLELTSGDATLPSLDLREARMRAEREVLQLALARSDGGLAAAARLLGVSRPTLYGMLETHNLVVDPGSG